MAEDDVRARRGGLVGGRPAIGELAVPPRSSDSRRGARVVLAVFGLAVALAALVGLRAAGLASAAGANFVVSSTTDRVDQTPNDGVCATAAPVTCTLRAAIQQANALPGPDTIQVPAGTYELAIPPLNQNLADVGDLDITDSLIIAGAGAGSTIVDGGAPTPGAPTKVRGLDRLFEVLVDGGTVSFSGLTFSDGYAAEYGGAIVNNSTAEVTVTASTLRGNVAEKAGGAIDNHLGGAVHVRDSTLSDNVAFESGSVLNNQRDGTLTVTNSTLSSNSAADIGLDEALAGAGAIANNAELDARGTITVTDSRISDNVAGGSRSGAAISNDGAGTLTVDRTTLSKNRAEVDGGAIFNGAGEVTVRDSTFSENAGESGGAIYNSAKDGRMTVSRSTFSLNRSAARGGAIATAGTGNLTVTDSVFTKNSAEGWGGAVVNDDKGSVAISNSTFTENSGLNGGGFANEGDGLVTVENSTFTKNKAVDTATLAGGEGGGMQSNSGGEVVITGGSFSENLALSGGGFTNEGGGHVTITGTRFSANRADEKGGGILIQSGTVRMVDIDVIGNVADGASEAGGGIAYEGDKLVSIGEAAAIENSRIRDNKAKGQGGGIDSRGDGPLDITTTTIAGNTAAMGGGIHHVGDAPLEVIRSTLSGNFAESGGGLFTDGDGETTVVNATVSGNRAGQFGGGLLVSSRLIVRNSTVASNTAASGGGINNGGGDLVGDGTVFLANTIVASSPTGGNCVGAMTSRGGNIDSGNTCQLRALSDQPGTDPLLEPLASNGGLTQTHALLADSPAQEKAVCTDVDPCPATDQRGVERPLFGGFDTGAYESELTPSGGGGGQLCTGRSERPVLADFDSWVSQGTPASNFGGDSILKVKSLGGGNQRTLVHFTLPSVPPGCTLVGATLRLHASAATEGRTLEVLRIASAWSEAGVTWEDQPQTAGPAAAAQSGIGLREWNVLGQTRDMYELGDHGFLIRDAVEGESGEQSLHATEKGADPPELILVFDAPGAPPLGDECPTTPQSLSADRDSWVSQGSPTNNFGTDSTLKVKSQAGYNARALVHFPLPTLPARCTGIASATLRLEASSGTDGRTLETLRAGSEWSETGVTWNNQPVTAGSAATAPSLNGPLEWAVTEHVVDMYLSADHGFLIRDAEENGIGQEQTLNGRLKLNDGAPELVLVFDDSTPETTLGPAPVSPTEDTGAGFTFFSDQADATFQCSLDGEPFAACTSPHEIRGLTLGDHTFEVRSTRNVRAVDPTPARHTWTVADLTAPVVTLAGGPDGETEATSVTFTFEANEQASFACTLDGTAVAECVSPLELRDLALGEHTFQVKATDPSGNVDEAGHIWTVVDRTAPTIAISGPDDPTEARSAVLTFSADEPAALSCRLDDALFADCASGQASYSGLALGRHTFEVSATDVSGNVGSASYAWTVHDVTAPTVSISGPVDPTEERSARLEFSASEEASLACTLDATAVVGCASPLERSGLALGRHTFEVSATDPSGNVGSASYAWTVHDVTAPTVSISGPDDPTEARSAELTFSADEPANLSCRLDDALFADCASGQASYGGLSLGRHTFEVSATDVSGNVGSASYAWTVHDVTAPTVSISGPDDPTEARSAELTFSADEPAALSCRLDTDAFAACDSGAASYSELALGRHTFDVRATDPSGNTGAASYGWTIVDRTPPTVSITGPEAETEDHSASLSFSADEEATLQCRLDAEAIADCPSGSAEYTGLALGAHTFDVKATDPSGNEGAASYAWTVVDRTSPTVSITGPEAETEARSASFTFSTDEPATLECRLDSGVFAGCASGAAEYTGLSLGRHTFDVRATDGSGNVGSTTHTWTVVDRSAPTISLTGPPAETEDRAASFTFSANEPATLECRLDAAAYAECASGHAEYAALGLGAHSFDVRATDASGNVASATHAWTIVDRTAPTVSLTGPAAETEDRSATFTFSADEPASFACSLDGAALSACESPVELDGLALGEHVFLVEATDGARNAGSASHTWTIVAAPPPPDTTAPTVSISGPLAETQERSATLTFSADEAATFACSLDNAEFAGCESPVQLTGLALGDHTFEVRATDGANNVGSASHGWKIVAPPDTAPPTVSLSGPPAETEETSATLTFSADEPATFVCSLDSAEFAACESPVELSGLALGDHTFDVQARDASSNLGSASHAWTIVAAAPPPDTAPPTVSISGPPTETQETSAIITFSADEAATFVCSLDSAEFAACESPVELSGLALGDHTLQVRATDGAGNVGSASHGWKIVAPPPVCRVSVVSMAGATADSWVLQTSPTSNYGSDSVVKVDSKANANARALVRFALPEIPSGCRLQDAKLLLYAGSYKENRTLQALRLGSEWNEQTVTWNTQPAAVGPAATVASDSGYLEWSVTSQVTDMYASGNYGFLIRDANEGGPGVEQGFHSREKGGDNPPQLVLVYG